VKTQPPLTLEERTHRVATLCAHCLRNIAFYRAGFRYGRMRFRVDRQFWINANSGFVDIAVLEWWKLFVEHNGKHGWRRVVSNPRQFQTSLYRRLGFSAEQFVSYAKSLSDYRNQFVAHLDDESYYFVPRLRMARRSAAHLYDQLRTDPKSRVFVPDMVESAAQYYSRYYQHAIREYLEGAKF
jgi:hypothetical protein